MDDLRMTKILIMILIFRNDYDEYHDGCHDGNVEDSSPEEKNLWTRLFQAQKCMEVVLWVLFIIIIIIIGLICLLNLNRCTYLHFFMWTTFFSVLPLTSDSLTLQKERW